MMENEFIVDNVSVRVECVCRLMELNQMPYPIEKGMSDQVLRRMIAHCTEINFM